MTVTVNSRSNITIKVRKEDGRITVTDPVTIKNQLSQYPRMGDIQDVRIVNLVDGAILRYNSNTQTYDVAPANTLSVGQFSANLITANSISVGQFSTNQLSANSLTLVNPLAAIYGGTGINLYAAGDILYASNTTHLMKLALGDDDTVLTVNNGVLEYSNVIDGGFYGI